MTALSLTARKARLTTLRDVIDLGVGGYLRLYTGSSVPASPDTSTSETLLANIPLAYPSGSITDAAGVAIYTIATPCVASALVTGVVGWARFTDKDGNGVLDREVVKSPAMGSIVLSETQLYVGGEIQLLSCIIKE